MTLADIFEPVSDMLPAGADLRFSPEWAHIAQLRRAGSFPGISVATNASEPVWAANATSTNASEPDWREIANATSSLLREKTKDLRLALWFVEAEMSISGLDGLCLGLEIFNGLIQKFWDRGLYPNDEPEQRIDLLALLDRKLKKALPQVEVGNPDRVAFAIKLLRELEILLYQHDVTISFADPIHQLENLRPADQPAPEPEEEPEFDDSIRRLEPSVVPSPLNSWGECIDILRNGRFWDADEKMSKLAETEPSPRDVFLRSLEIASACVAHDRLAPARGILLALVEQAERLELERWESPVLLARMWSLLYKSCKSEEAELRQRAYSNLCRMVPWAAPNLES